MSKRKVRVGSSHETPTDPFEDLIQGPREVAERTAQEQQAAPPAPAAQTPRGAGGAPAELTMEQIQATPKAERRPTNFALPNALELHRRMTYYKADHDVQIQDQIALATDRWLREQGY